MLINDGVKTKKIVILIILLILGLIFSYTFKKYGKDELEYLPLHIPVLIGGFLLNPVMAMVLGLLTPILTSLVFKSIVWFPDLLIMVLELGVYGLIVSLMYRKLKLPSLLSLIIAMILGRAMSGAVIFFLTPFFTMGMDPINFVKEAAITGLPGIIIQLVILPLLIYWIERHTTINFD